MYCKECKEEYYTKLREIKNKNETYFYPVSYEKYHCQILGFDETIKCNKCKSDLYLDINSNKNRNKINEVFCKKCKNIYDVNEINNICFNCKTNFKSKLKIYNFFSQTKIDLLTVIHSLFHRKSILPLMKEKKQCRCDLSQSEILKHNDGGYLLEGERMGQKVIVCNKCFSIFNLDNFEWICPKCKREFDIKKRNIYEYKLKAPIYINDDNALKNTSEFKNKNNLINNSPLSNKKEKIKKKNENYNNKYSTTNNSIQKTNNRITNFIYKNTSIKTDNLINNKYKTINKSNKQSRSLSYLKENDILKKDYKKLELNTRNDLRNGFMKRKNNIKKNYTTDDNINFIIKKNSSLNNQRKNISYKKKEIKNNNNYKKTFYSKAKNKEKINDIKKKLFFEINNNKTNKMGKKNYSVTNSLVMIKKKDNIIYTARKMLKMNDNKDINRNKGIKYNKRNNIKANVSLNNKNIKKINQINNINKANNINVNNNKDGNQIKNINKEIIIEKRNNHKNNIRININVNNSNNYYNNNDNSYVNNNNFKKIKNNESKDPIKKNNIQIINNLDNNQNNLHNKNNIKNQKFITSDTKPSNINNLNQSQNVKHQKEHIKITDNIPQKKNMQIMPQKNKNQTNNVFHSDDYNIVDLIGEGTYGKIYLVKKNKTDEIYALKQISVKNKIDSNKHKKQFESLKILTETNPNLNIIKILGIEEKQLDKFSTVLYILMEAGKSDWEKEIYKRNKEQRYYTEDELIDIITSLVSTFAFLQEKGISHRDVKPQNIVFFEKKGKGSKNLYKITDFGEAKINYRKNVLIRDNFEDNTLKQTVRGTELYMSPLLFNTLRNTREIDIKYNPYKNDVYSLGLCILLAASLSYIPLYQIREIKSMDKIKSDIEGYLNKLYSKTFINLILVMLEINEKFRPDFIELNSWINNHYFNQ